mgnify:CR=1 FL=1|jgi:large subunit ribosomal protein L21
MYAIIQNGGKQYNVKKDSIIDIEKLPVDIDSDVEFSEVLFLHDGENPHVGAPFLSNCVVKGIMLDEIKGPKVISFKFKRRKSSSRKVGHRQKYSRVKITDIVKE